MIKQPGHQDRVVRLPEGATRMGRAEDNEVVLADLGVSRRHAQVFVSRNEVTVEDLGSGNGTYYNGYRVQSQPISDGDEIVIDPFVLQFRVRGATAQPGANAPGRAPSGAPAPEARLEVVVGKGMAGTTYPITSRGLSIGRSEDRDVVIPDPAASRHHAQITVQGPDCVLRDMGASNGIFVNAVRVRECTLADGDVLRIGNTEMRFIRGDGSAPAARAPANASMDVRVQPPSHQPPSWNEPSLGPGQGYASARPVHEAPPPRRRSRASPIIAMVFGTFLVFLTLLLVVVVVVVGLIAYLKFAPTGVTAIPSEPPGWSLKEPPGLPPQKVSELFEQGRQKMKTNDRRGALLDFYRALKADPAYLYVDKFAFAAGEYLVLDELQKEFSARAGEKRERLARRDRLLADARSNNRTKALAATTTLKREYKTDPLVMERLELPVPESVVALEKTLSEATEKMTVGKYDEASELFRKVLAETDDPKIRNEALASLRLSQKDVARSSQQVWTEAVSLSRTDAAASEVRFRELANAHPSNVSAQVHLQRMK